MLYLDSIITKAHPPDAVDPVETCTELMAALEIEVFLYFISFTLFLRFMTVASNLLCFQAGPWTASVSSRVKSLQAEAKFHESQAVKADREL